jgi:hypothetical protein
VAPTTEEEGTTLLNVDLEVISRTPLDSLVQAFGRKVDDIVSSSPPTSNCTDLGLNICRRTHRYDASSGGYQPVVKVGPAVTPYG